MFRLFPGLMLAAACTEQEYFSPNKRMCVPSVAEGGYCNRVRKCQYSSCKNKICVKEQCAQEQCQEEPSWQHDDFPDCPAWTSVLNPAGPCGLNFTRTVTCVRANQQLAEKSCTDVKPDLIKVCGPKNYNVDLEPCPPYRPSDAMAQAFNAALRVISDAGTWSSIQQSYQPEPAPEAVPFIDQCDPIWPPKSELQALFDSQEIRIGYKITAPRVYYKSFEEERAKFQPSEFPLGFDPPPEVTEDDIGGLFAYTANLLVSTINAHYGANLRVQYNTVGDVLDHSQSGKDFIEEAQEGRHDAFIGPLAITTSRKRDLSMTCPFMTVNFGYFSKLKLETFDDLSGLKIAVNPGIPSRLFASLEVAPRLTVIHHDEDTWDAVVHDEVDVGVMAVPELNWALRVDALVPEPTCPSCKIAPFSLLPPEKALQFGIHFLRS